MAKKKSDKSGRLAKGKKTGAQVEKKPAPKVISLDEVYRLINRVQVGKKEVHFFLSPEDAVIASNVLRDLDLKYELKEQKTRVEFTIHPNPDEVTDEERSDIDIDFFQDEFPEEGHLF